MTEPVQLYQLRVDGLVAEENIPVAQLSGLLNSYGVVRDDTLNRLMAGQRQQVLGQVLELSRQAPEFASGVYTLLVNGRVAAKDVPDAKLAKLLASYGASKKETTRSLVAGLTRRVLGQDLKLLHQGDGQTAEKTSNHALPTTKAVAEPTALIPNRTQTEPDLPARAPKAPTPFDAPLQELLMRAKKLRKGTLIFGVSALVLALLGGVLYSVGIAVEPTTTIHHILVPDTVAKAFQSVENAGVGLTSTGNVSIIAEELFGGVAFRVVCLIAMVMGMAFSILAGRYLNAIPYIMVGIAPQLLGTILGFGDVQTTSKPNEFASAIESKNLSTLQRLLSSRADIDDVAKAYVLAQASVADGRSTRWVVETVRNLREGKNEGSFTVPSSVAYAIEATDLGQDAKLSDKAEQHRQNALAEARDWKRKSIWALLLAGVLGVVATGHESIAQIIFRRVRRISKLLDPVMSSFIHPRR